MRDTNINPAERGCTPRSYLLLLLQLLLRGEPPAPPPETSFAPVQGLLPCHTASKDRIDGNVIRGQLAHYGGHTLCLAVYHVMIGMSTALHPGRNPCLPCCTPDRVCVLCGKQPAQTTCPKQHAKHKLRLACCKTSAQSATSGTMPCTMCCWGWGQAVPEPHIHNLVAQVAGGRACKQCDKDMSPHSSCPPAAGHRSCNYRSEFSILSLDITRFAGYALTEMR